MNPADRGITLGNGPFQPPTAHEAATLEEKVRNLEARIERLQPYLVYTLDTPGDLEALLARALPGEVSVDVVSDEDSIEVHVDNLTVNDDGEFTQPSEEYEVRATITLHVGFHVEASGYREADERAADALAELSDDLDLPTAVFGEGFVENSEEIHDVHASLENIDLV